MRKRIKPVECLNNYVERDIREAYSPLMFIQSVFLMPPFCVTGGFLTPAGAMCCVKAFVGASYHIAIRAYHFWFLIKSLGKDPVMDIVLVISTINVFCFFSATVMIYVTNLIQSHNALQLLIKLRTAMQVIDFKRRNILNAYKRWNLIWIIEILVFHFIIAVLQLGNHGNFSNIIVIVGKLSFLIFDIHVVCAYRNILITTDVLSSWNHKMMIYICERDEDADRKDMKAMFSAYKNVINAFGVCKHLYQFTVLYHMMALFVYAMYNLQLEIAKSKSDIQEGVILLRQLITLIWNTKNFVLLVCLSLACERMYEQVRVSQATSAQAMVVDVTDDFDIEMRRSSKNALRYSQAAFRPLAVSGARVDAATPLRLLRVVVMYTVVMLQFALCRQ